MSARAAPVGHAGDGECGFVCELHLCRIYGLRTEDQIDVLDSRLNRDRLRFAIRCGFLRSDHINTWTGEVKDKRAMSIAFRFGSLPSATSRSETRASAIGSPLAVRIVPSMVIFEVGAD